MKTRDRRWPTSPGLSSLAVPVFVILCALIPVFVRAGDTDSTQAAAREKYFEQNVRPLLTQKCYSCHSTKKQKGGLRLDSIEAILKGGTSGPAIVPGKAAESLLVQAVNYAGPEMPPDGKLAAEQVAVITRWIASGAAWPRRDVLAHAANNSIRASAGQFTASDRALWSLQPLRDSKPPALSGPAYDSWLCWPKSPIDRFVLNSLREKGLVPTSEASRESLIRRVTFDLTGLPPTKEEVDLFVSDETHDAYERLVDRLLASPSYGQRWAGHWLDLVRYAESDGYRQDAFRPSAWRYRDYVVRAFNTDKPYDRFVREQLAGDELDPDDPELRVAAGYLRMGTYEYNQRDVCGQWADILNDITDVTGEVFLGLSIGCARCHDHKFDPILQRDYYRLQAFFAPLLPRDDLTIARSDEWAAFRAKRAAWEKATTAILDQISAIEQPYRDKGAQTAMAKFPAEIQAILHKSEKDRTPFEKQIGTLAYRQIAFEHGQVPAQIKGPDKARWDKLQKELKSFGAARPVVPAQVLSVSDVGPVAPPTAIPGETGEKVIEPGYLSVLDPAAARVERSSAAPQSTGRRLALARWLTRATNPLSTRVIVNRIWQYHFGRGLVGTPSDFGRLGEAPSHPELLDWLAEEFVNGDWQLKPLQRLIVTSAVYRQSASPGRQQVALAQRVDPENRLLWKHGGERLDAGEIRDSMLVASGELNTLMGGPSSVSDQLRRTIDTRIIRNSPDEVLDVFDGPDGNLTTPRRNTTTTASQALLLINGGWGLARAEAFARRLEREKPSSADIEGRVVLAYRLAVGRSPLRDEIAEAVSFLGSQARAMGAPPHRADAVADHAALVDFCHVLFNSNEFLYLD